MPSRGPSAPTAARKEVSNELDCLLTVDEAAERLGTGVRFVRRLVAERRIVFVKVGRHVRIADSALTAYIEAHTVQPARRVRPSYGRAA
ncbi:helix-turn-helix domain-containing protein [Streptomyces sp. IB2014 016-6]|uniref:helix-turn-helix domain-containing protein n=1 Tax=Streptomyces sp. IB2014 016-6 TaxID=2517818 RepID=UPI001F4F7A51|nr:helix-turn-helix domain-containing protein [Streptomyces sp. IB2014 016-6]